MAIEILSPNYILPDNDVWLLKGVPLENNYDDTVIWQQGIDIDGTPILNETASQAKERQFNYFTAVIGMDTRYHHLRLPAMTYLREGRKYLRVDIPYTRAIQYNYMIFKNKGTYTIGESTTAYHYENRYYYAFITKCEYLNDKTTIIHYEIDIMQTYNFDYTLMKCFVEREHVENDAKFSHNIPEDVTVGEYKFLDLGLHDSFNILTYRIVIAASFSGIQDPTTGKYVFSTAGGGYRGGIYSGLYFNVFSDAVDANKFLMDATDQGKQDGIVSVFMMPNAYIGSDTIFHTSIPWNLPANSQLTDSWTYEYIENGITKTGPRNKKLYSNPYTSLIIANGNGDIGEYGLQFFNLSANNYYTFLLLGQCSPTPEFACVPLNYKNILVNYNEKIIINTMPQCAYTIDAYRAWLAQNKVRIVSSIASAAGSAIVGAVSTTPAVTFGGAVSAMHTITGILNEAYQASILAPQVNGKQTPSLSVMTGELGFHAYTKIPTDEYAKIIDDYFDLYGYACHEVKIPNRTVRPVWCYTKTVGCRLESINTGIPADVDDAIRAIYNKGVRFWKNPGNIGDYSLNNRV